MSRPLRAVSLPRAREQIAARLRRDAQEMSGSVDPRFEWAAKLWQTQADALATASLWWVAPDMATLAVDTGLSGDELPVWYPDEVSRTGLLVWDGGLPIRIMNRSEYRPDEPVVIDAVSWAPIPEQSQHPDMNGMRIEMWSRQGFADDPRGDDPLKIVTVRFGAGDERVPVGDDLVTPEYAIWRILSATMLLSHQPTVGSTRPANFAVDGAAKDRRTREVPEVTVVDLRTLGDWRVGPNDSTPGDGREYSHRWIVRGHMRTYHVGTGRERTEKRWIAPYVAGPEGAPLIPKEHVWVWRR